MSVEAAAGIGLEGGAHTPVSFLMQQGIVMRRQTVDTGQWVSKARVPHPQRVVT